MQYPSATFIAAGFMDVAGMGEEPELIAFFDVGDDAVLFCWG